MRKYVLFVNNLGESDLFVTDRWQPDARCPRSWHSWQAEEADLRAFPKLLCLHLSYSPLLHLCIASWQIHPKALKRALPAHPVGCGSSLSLVPHPACGMPRERLSQKPLCHRRYEKAAIRTTDGIENSNGGIVVSAKRVSRGYPGRTRSDCQDRALPRPLGTLPRRRRIS